MSKQIPALIKDCYDDLGYAEVMHAIGELGEKAGYKYTHPEGEPMPMLKFERLIAYVGKRARPLSMSAIYKIGSFLMQPVNGIVIDREIIKAMNIGQPLSAIVIPKEVTEMCKHCDNPVRYLPVCDCRWSRR
jgi:hypothetical protein